MATIKEVKNKHGLSYQVTIRIKPYKTIYKTFKDASPRKAKKDAQQWASKIEYEMAHGLYKEYNNPICSNRENISTMQDLITFFQNEVASQRYRTPEKYSVMYSWWIAKIGSIKVQDLSASMLSSCKHILKTEKIKKGKQEVVRGNNTINKYLMCLSAVLTYAVKELELIDVNPISKVGTLPKPDGRKRFLSIDEIQNLVSACKSHSDFLYMFVLLSLSTGGRYSEILKLTINNIDFQNNQVFFLNTKNKEDRGVPVSAEVLQTVKDYIQKNNIEEYLFLNKKTNKLYYVRGVLQEVIKNVGLKDFHIHDLRHTTASYIAMNGGSLLDIAEILGHKSLVMARRYSHLTQKHTASVLNRVTNKILPKF